MTSLSQSSIANAEPAHLLRCGGRLSPAAICAAITDNAASPLVRTARTLSPFKRRVFNAAYASMRMIDDRVDHGGKDQVPEAIAAMDEWKNALFAAAVGEIKTLPEANETAAILELSKLLPAMDLGIAPWLSLIRAMHQDLNREVMQSWQEFDDYADGASVAPTQVFLYLLLAREDGGRLALDVDLSPMATPLGRFCYLAHILRDLVEDAQTDAWLLTVPIEAMGPFRSRDAFAAALIASNPACAEVRQAIIARARCLEQDCQKAIEDIAKIDPDGAALSAVTALVDHYAGILNAGAMPFVGRELASSA